MRSTLLALFVLGASSQAWAHGHHFYPGAGHADWATPSAITCDTVRSYVNMMGVAQARALALALANGMTGAQERRARRCLASD
jgi:hypothetical protein